MKYFIKLGTVLLVSIVWLEIGFTAHASTRDTLVYNYANC